MMAAMDKDGDADKDKKLTAAELLSAAKAVFDEFDKKKAGKLDEDGFADWLGAVFPAPKFGPPKDKKWTPESVGEPPMRSPGRLLPLSPSLPASAIAAFPLRPQPGWSAAVL